MPFIESAFTVFAYNILQFNFWNKMEEGKKLKSEKQPQEKSLDMTFAVSGEAELIAQLKAEVQELRREVTVIRQMLEVMLAHQGVYQQAKSWTWHMYFRVNSVGVSIGLLKELLKEILREGLV